MKNSVMHDGKIKKIALISQDYPTKDDPVLPFVEQICNEFARQSVDVYVVSPQSIVSALRHRKKPHPCYREEHFGNASVRIYQPYRLLSVPYRFMELNNRLFKKSVEKQLKKLPEKPDVCYGHFWFNAYAVCDYAHKHNIPLFAVAGEGNLMNREQEFKKAGYDLLKSETAGCISVSSYNKELSVKMELIGENDCVVIPNAIDNKLFCQKSREELRKQYGYPLDKFIVAFVGYFENRKGPQRVSKAIDSLNDDNICSFFLGGSLGEINIQPDCKGILKSGKVEHDSIPDYLNMADIFVLPTLNEGCCNAVVEALACGLPVVSSNLPFNWDVLDESNSIMIDPYNVDEIAAAIKKLKDEPELRQRLSEGALAKAAGLTIEQRAKKILAFMEDKINNV